jgi:hypothetical protein
MGDLVNLRQARKQKQREAHEADAAANRQKFGRTKAEKQKTGAERKLAEKSLDGHKRDP